MMSDEEEWRPEEMPTIVIAHLGRLLTRASDHELRKAGITASQLPVLVALKDGERRTQSDLARIAGVEQPSMAQLLGRMEREGLVRREPSTDDRRSSLISLTDAALQRLAPGRDALRAVDTKARSGFTEADLRLFLGFIARMANNIAAE